MNDLPRQKLKEIIIQYGLYVMNHNAVRDCYETYVDSIRRKLPFSWAH